MPDPSERPAAADAASSPGQSQQQAQTQTQTQSIEISIGSAGDPELESRIFRDVHSVGRQLSRISLALSVLIDHLDLDPELPPVADAKRALADFREMRADIRKELQDRDDRLISSLEKIRMQDPSRYASLAPRLRDLLREEPSAAGKGSGNGSEP